VQPYRTQVGVRLSIPVFRVAEVLAGLMVRSVVDAMTVRQMLDMYGYAGPRFSLALFGTFAAAALPLAVAGTYLPAAAPPTSTQSRPSAPTDLPPQEHGTKTAPFPRPLRKGSESATA
jgi:hypothetical protein